MLAETNKSSEVVAEPQATLESVLNLLGEIETKIKDSQVSFNTILEKLPQGAITDKVATGITKRLKRIGKANDSAASFLNKRNQVLTKQIISTTAKKERKAAKLAKAEARFKKQQEKLATMQKLTGNG